MGNLGGTGHEGAGNAHGGNVAALGGVRSHAIGHRHVCQATKQPHDGKVCHGNVLGGTNAPVLTAQRSRTQGTHRLQHAVVGPVLIQRIDNSLLDAIGNERRGIPSYIHCAYAPFSATL